MIIALSRIRSTANPIRSERDEEALEVLTKSLRSQGRCIVPIKVRPVKDEKDFFEVVFGNRRLEAARRLQWNEIDCIIEEADDIEALKQEFIENAIREDMTPIDKAKALKKLQEEGKFTLKELEAEGYGSFQSISRSLALLELPENVQEIVASVDENGKVPEGKITPYHVRMLEGKFVDDEFIEPILQKAARDHLTAEATRQVARNISMMKPEEVDEYLEKPTSNRAVVALEPEEKETNPDVLEYIEWVKEFRDKTMTLSNAIDNDEIEVTEKAATYIFRQTGLMYGLWDHLRGVIQKKQSKEITE